jgi:hypothetical protein
MMNYPRSFNLRREIGGYLVETSLMGLFSEIAWEISTKAILVLTRYFKVISKKKMKG